MLRWTVWLKEGQGPTKCFDAAVPVGPEVYFFGRYELLGVHYSGQIDVHIFNTVSLRWSKLSPVTNGRGEVPSWRVDHTAVLIQDIIYLWGGYPRPQCNILYTFDVDTHRWLKPEVSGTVPEGRRSHSACVLGKLIYVHGGYSEHGRVCTNDIYKLDTIIMVWSLINTRGTTPAVSAYHSATIIGTKMFAFGGWGGNEYLNNITVFDTETNCWLRTPSAQLLPKRRCCHSAFTYNGELYIFGGNNDIQTFNDLWKFNPETLTWKKFEPKGKGPHLMTEMCCCMVGGHIVLFGGYPRTSDLYILDLSPSLKSLCKLAVIQYSVEQSGLPHDIRWELTAMTKEQ